VVVSLSPGIVLPGEGISVELKSSKYVLSQKIARIAPAGNEAIIAFSGVNSINDALKIVGYSLYADLTAVKKKPLATVLGFSVFDGAGNCWGKVKAQPQYSLNQLLEVEDGQSGEIFYVPWHDSIVKKIDRRAKTICIDPPEGLRDLNR
jgi:ribosomal 30S subunit maturation factor RimM